MKYILFIICIVPFAVNAQKNFTITGNVPKKGDFSFTGSMVFNGDGTANLTVNGTVYIVNLETGEKTKK